MHKQTRSLDNIDFTGFLVYDIMFPLTFLLSVTDPLSEFELYELADSLNADKVMMLGMYLGFSIGEITTYQTSVMLPRDGTVKMLFVWRDRQTRDSERRILSRVLDEMGCAQLADHLRAHGGKMIVHTP